MGQDALELLFAASQQPQAYSRSICTALTRRAKTILVVATQRGRESTCIATSRAQPGGGPGAAATLDHPQQRVLDTLKCADDCKQSTPLLPLQPSQLLFVFASTCHLRG